MKLLGFFVCSVFAAPRVRRADQVKSWVNENEPTQVPAWLNLNEPTQKPSLNFQVPGWVNQNEPTQVPPFFQENEPPQVSSYDNQVPSWDYRVPAFNNEEAEELAYVPDKPEYNFEITGT